MPVTLFMVQSLNGIVATEKYSEDFLSEKNWGIFKKIVKQFGNVVIGAKTYDVVKQWGSKYDFDNFKEAVVVISRTREAGEKHSVASTPEEAVRGLQALGHKRVLVAGGSTVNSLFMESGLVGEIIFNIDPVVVGQGIPVFASSTFEKHLQLKAIKRLPGGIVQVWYQVK